MLHFLRCGGEAESASEFTVKSPQKGTKLSPSGENAMEPKEEEGERERGRGRKEGPTLSRNKQASRQCAVGGTRPWKHVVPFFLAFFSPLFHARFSSRFLFVPPPLPSSILSRARFRTLIPSASTSSVSFLFLACSKCAFEKFRDRCASSALKFSGHPPGRTRKVRYICCISIDDLGAGARRSRSYCFEKSD